jgi:uncharacterized protein YbbK (DUF523 family)
MTRGGRGPVVVSACLLGLPCRYDGAAKPSAGALRALAGRDVIPVCPEVAAGLGVPRPPFRQDRTDAAAVVATRRGLPDAAGEDVAPRLVPACERLAAAAPAAAAGPAILKERSPSCGVHEVHGPAGMVSGRGVLTELLVRSGIAVKSDEDVSSGAAADPLTTDPEEG